MPSIEIQSGLAGINGAQLYYELAGEGPPLVMIHAGVADSRQWENEFEHFAANYQVLRYDLRGYGRSEPVDTAFSHLGDLAALLDLLEIKEPLALMGCSMGGGLALDFALTHPRRVRALVLVDSAPDGLELEVESPAKFKEAYEAYQAGDLERVAEIETQIWFDGMGRTPEQVDPEMRALAKSMNRLALGHEAKGLGKRLPDAYPPAAERLDELQAPVLVIAGEHDVPYILAAAEYMAGRLPKARKVIIPDAAHLPNLDHPQDFQAIVEPFLKEQE